MVSRSKQKISLFKKDFYWGASTAGHQVESGLHDQWTVWELEHAVKSARGAKSRLGWLQNWDEIKVYAQSPKNYVSGDTTKHDKKYEDDFKILKQLNLNAFRFSIEWSRLEPEPGQWDQSAIDYYHKYIDKLQEMGIEPFLNLWHWTMPAWFTDMGGFEKRENIEYFDKFVEKVASEFAGKLKFVITLNEPNVYASTGYVIGIWPPGEKSIWKFMRTYYHLSVAHNRAYKILKAHNDKLQIGVASQLANIQAKRPHNMIDGVVTKVMRYAWNWWFLNRTRKHQDFIGLNYYFTDYYKNFHAVNPSVPVNDMGWYMEPEGIYPLLVRIWVRYKKPIIITENGLADADDSHRRWWIEQTMVAMERALSEGVDLRGYMHWSLLDNFEWAEGFWPRFGLVEIDYKTKKRKIRPSAMWWAQWLSKI